MKRLPRKWILFGAITLLVLGLITVVSAPSSQREQWGSSYRRTPDGYGAWVAWMEEKGVILERSRTPVTQLIEQRLDGDSHTLLQIHSPPWEWGQSEALSQWVQRGNTLVVLGIYRPATKAPFRSDLESSQGVVRIDTKRRQDFVLSGALLRDKFGIVVWRESVGEGQIIYSTTPFLAANAYQDAPANFKFLAQLVLGDDGDLANTTLWIDEYLHGYKDEATITEEVGETLWDYFAMTPLLPLACQGGILLVIAIIASQRRFGPWRTQPDNTTENSQAYIQALASVLHKAQAHGFPLRLIAQAEQRQLQKQLGLGERLLDHPSLLQAWQEHTGQAPTLLTQVLDLSIGQPVISEGQLLTWLQQWHTIRQLAQSSP